jgi:RND family efflux transporter MFP subunit
VNKGQPLLTFYSPEALATQQEYLLALKAQQAMHDNPMHEITASTENLLTAARRRLELWDISDAQIETIRKSGEPLKDLTLYSPISGFVTERNAFPQQHITPDTMLYTVADLATVWVIADVFEYEAANVRVGQSASMTLTYLPGKSFHGRVSYILPQVDPTTRTLKVRIQLNNPGYALKPDMYGEVELHGSARRMLTVPQTAVMNSGERQVVFIDRGNGYFEPRPVTIGQQMDGRTEILSGLAAGERIVTSGNFLIDSESRMQAAAGGAQGGGHDQSHH